MDYENALGQLVNMQKSGFYVLRRCSRQKAQLISAWSGCTQQMFPIKYLGMPLFKGRIRQAYFEEVEAKIIRQISGWKSQLLSFGAKLVLLRAVLSSILV